MPIKGTGSSKNGVQAVENPSSATGGNHDSEGQSYLDPSIGSEEEGAQALRQQCNK